jgi:hypothetical protein
MIDHELLSEPPSGDDSTSTAGSRSEQNSQAEASERIRAAVQPSITAADILRDSVADTSRLACWAKDMAEQNNRALAGIVGPNSAFAALANYRSPLVEATQRIREAFEPTRIQVANTLAQLQHVGWAEFGSQITESLDWISSVRLPGEMLLEFGRRAARAGRALRERLYFALLAARDAALRGDKSAVAAFFEEWAALPRSKPSARMQAAMDALIAAPLDDLDPDLALPALKNVRVDTQRRFERGRRPLGETTIRGQEIGSLDADPRKLTDVLSIRCPGGSVEERTLFRLNDQADGQLDDERLVAVIRGMTRLEQQVI